MLKCIAGSRPGTVSKLNGICKYACVNDAWWLGLNLEYLSEPKGKQMESK